MELLNNHKKGGEMLRFFISLVWMLVTTPFHVVADIYQAIGLVGCAVSVIFLFLTVGGFVIVAFFII